MNRLDDLERLGKLRDAGGLTAEDFEREKAAILTRSVAAARAASKRWPYFILPGAAVTAIAGLLLYQPTETPRQGSPNDASGALAASPAPSASQPVILPQSSPESAAAPSAEGPFTFPATPGTVMLTNCHMGECIWQQLQSLAVVRQEGGSLLVKLAVRNGTSEHEDTGAEGDYPTRYEPNIPIVWEERTEYVLCSKAHPGTIFWEPESRQYIATGLNLVSPAGFETSSVNTYMAVCHDSQPDTWSASSVEKLGYQDQTGNQVRLAAPEDIFGRP